MVCERWIENPYFQFFSGETFFQHALPVDRSSITRWRQRIGAAELAALAHESPAAAHRSGAKPKKGTTCSQARRCQSAPKRDPRSAWKRDPGLGRARAVAFALAELAGLAQPGANAVA